MQYHFPSRQNLVLSAIEYVAHRVDQAMQANLAMPLEQATPVERMLAYVEVVAAGRLTRGDLAVVIESLANPTYSAPWVAIFERWLDLQDVDDSQTRLQLSVVRLAADGLWLSDATGIGRPGPGERTDLIAHLRSLKKAIR